MDHNHWSMTHGMAQDIECLLICIQLAIEVLIPVRAEWACSDWGGNNEQLFVSKC